MKYMRWPAKTRNRAVPGLAKALTEELEARKRREAYLRVAFPPYLSDPHYSRN